MDIRIIAALLHWTEAQVQAYHEDLYFKWCNCYADEFGYRPQSLIANTAINKWFNEQYNLLEQEAYESLIAGYDQMKADKAQAIYKVIVGSIYQNYPKVLFNDAIKLSINGDGESLEFVNKVAHGLN